MCYSGLQNKWLINNTIWMHNLVLMMTEFFSFLSFLFFPLQNLFLMPNTRPTTGGGRRSSRVMGLGASEDNIDRSIKWIIKGLDGPPLSDRHHQYWISKDCGNQSHWSRNAHARTHTHKRAVCESWQRGPCLLGNFSMDLPLQTSLIAVFSVRRSKDPPMAALCCSRKMLLYCS